MLNSEGTVESQEALQDPFADDFFGDELKDESLDTMDVKAESSKSGRQQRK